MNSSDCRLINADCKEALAELINDGIYVDSIVTDPPYEMNFMGKEWDRSGIAYDVEMWELCLKILKPGGHLLSFGGTRTYHKMASAIEDAGFEIRDQIMWVFGQGFPKSLNVGNGWGTNLKPAHEPIVLARKPLDEKTTATNVTRHGTGAINIDKCRVAINPNDPNQRPNGSIPMDECTGKMFKNIGGRNPGLNLNTLDMVKGRFPANLIHDGSIEVEKEFAEQSKRMGMHSAGNDNYRKTKASYTATSYHIADADLFRYGDTGTASRFFYAAKASKKERNGSKHPTIKPLSLMRYLCRLITPENGLVLDPFAGTGTTGQAAIEENLRAILIEKDAEHFNDACKRLEMTNEVAA